MQQEVDKELIDFLEGKDSPYFVTNIITDENTNKASIVYDKNNEKVVDIIEYEPFIYLKDLSSEFNSKFYKGDINWKYKAMEKHGITISRLRVTDKNGNPVERLDNGYKFLLKSKKSFKAIKDFFREGGLSLYQKTKDGSSISYFLKPSEQVMIQKNIKLFKGFEFYDDVHRMCFDIETTGLLAEENRVFLIGIADNKGYNNVLEVDEVDDDESERRIIIDFFKLIVEKKPSILFGYNSENFDFNFLIKRSEILGVNLSKILNITRTDASIKFGDETEVYKATNLFIDNEFYCNVIDTLHAVRRAKAINSDIKKTGLKYITKYSKANKKDRMYVEGNSIYKIWNENKYYLINPENNEYVKILDELQDFCENDKENSLLEKFKEKYPDKTKLIKGKDIVFQYLQDDLWETMKVDTIYNESSFMVSKWLSTSFTRTTTIGGASSWNLIMTDWSYKNNLAIPKQQKKEDFVGGISRTFMLGNLVLEKDAGIKKTDFAGLYPTIQLEYNIFPETDVTGILYRLLRYFKETRDIYKELANTDPDEQKRMLYKTKQLPLKIFNNSNFGANSSEWFNWSDFRRVGERITCTGRQYLRKMTYYMHSIGLKPAVCDTDGLNLVLPKTFEYDLDGNKLPEPVTADYFEFTNSKGKTYKGTDCFVAKFNEIMGHKFIKVDDDGYWDNSLNLARKNYVSYEKEIDKENKIIKHKLKMVGNSIKSSSLPKYVEDFLDEGIKLIIKNEPKNFIDLYHKTFSRVFYNEIPAIDIASKARVKMKMKTYINTIHIPNIIKNLFYSKDFATFEKKINKYNKIGKNQTEKFLLGQPNSKYDSKIKFLLKKQYIQNSEEIPHIIKDVLLEYNNYNSFDEWYNESIKKMGILESEEKFNEFLNIDIIPFFLIHGTKKGIPKAKQAHMELLLESNNPEPDLGETLYYINVGTKKTDANNKFDKNGNMVCQLVNPESEGKIIPYNTELYANFFNGKLKPLMVCFKQVVGENLLIKYETTETIDNSGKKPKTIKEKGFNPNNRKWFTEDEMELTNWTYETYPYGKENIDSLFDGGVNNVPLFQMEDREMVFWDMINIDPSIIFENFTCNIAFNKTDDYYDIYKILRDRLKNKYNLYLKIEKMFHEEGDLVLKKYQNQNNELEYWVCVFENGVYKKHQKYEK